MTHDYKRNGVTTLFAALNVRDGTVLGRCMAIAPSQSIAIDEDDVAEHPPIIDPRFAVTLGEIWPQTRHLLLGQALQVAHSQSPHGA